MTGLAQNGLHAPNVPLDQYSRSVTGRNPSSDALYYRTGLARARWMKLLQSDHTPQDAKNMQDGGIQVLVRVRGEGIVYHQDVLRAIHDYQGSAKILEIGNEPTQNVSDLWVHAWYIEKVLSECLTVAHQAKMQLCIGGWQMHVPPPDNTSALGKRLLELYRQFDLIGIHAYDPYDLLAPAVTGHLQRWMGAFPGKQYAITEYGIAAKAVANDEKARRYARFVNSLPSSVTAAFAFILGGTADFASFQAGGYDPKGENSYWLEDRSWELLGENLAK